MRKWMLILMFATMLGTTGIAPAENEMLHIVGKEKRRSTAVYLRQKADYVAVPVHIMMLSKTKEQEKQILYQRQTATELMSAIVKKKSPLKIKFAGLERQPYVYIMTPVETVSKDMGYYLKKVKTLFKPVFFSGKSQCMLGSPILAVDNPEQYRTTIVKNIISSVEALSSSLNSEVTIEITGLEKPVVVESVDDEYVDLFIPYTLSLEIVRGK